MSWSDMRIPLTILAVTLIAGVCSAIVANNAGEAEVARACIQNGGEWVTQDWRYVCVRPK